MEKKYISGIFSRSPRPRSKRLRQQGIGGLMKGNTVVTAGASGEYHTHRNKAALDQISTDEDGYLYLAHTQEEDGEEISIIEKVKAGYADEANHAALADLAKDLTEDSPTARLIRGILGNFIPMTKTGNTVSDTTWAAIDMGTPLFAVKSLKGFYSEEFLSAHGLNPFEGSATAGIDEAQLSQYLITNQYAKKSDIPSLSGYAKLTDIPSLAGYATETWVTNKGYITSSELSPYLKSTDAASTYLTKTDASSTYLSKTGASSTYLTKTDASLIYQPIGNYLTSHQTIYKLTFQSGSFSAKTYTPNSAAQTVNIPTTTSHITEGTRLYFTDARAQAALASTVSDLNTAIGTKLPTATFDTFKAGYDTWKSTVDAFISKFNDYFLLENVSGTKRIKALFGLYSDSFISARGLNGNSGGGTIGNRLDSWTDYATSKEGWVLSAKLGWDLKQRIDNLPTTSVNPYALTIQKNGTTVKTYDGSSAVTANITIGWADTASGRPAWIGANKPSYNFSEIGSKPTTLAGYGITDAVAAVDGKGLSSNDFTDALLTKLNGIEAGANKYVHPSNGANTTITAANGKVLSAITVNSLGHVTSVASKTLVAADIPTLAISKITGLQDALDSKLNATIFNNFKTLFETYFTLEDVNGVKRIKANYGFYSVDYVSAKGLNSTGGNGTTFGRLDSWSDYNAKGTDALSAVLGYGLKTRIDALEGKNYLNDLAISVTGSGNAVTAVTQSADKKTLTFTKSSTFLTAHQTLYTLTIQKNGTQVGTFKPNANATINLTDVASAATLSSHTGNGTIHITANERTLWNQTATNLSSILGSDASGVIDKWDEIVAFLDTYTEADTLAGLLSNKADKTTKISAGTGLTGGGTLAADRTLSLATSGVTAGTYFKTTVDAYGRVTAGSNPTTLAGFGITDAYTKTEADAKYVTLATNQTITGQKIFNTATNTKPLVIARNGSTFESVSIGVDDGNVRFLYENDEVSSNMVFTLKNTDTENSNGSRASERSFILSATQTALNASLPGTMSAALLKVTNTGANAHIAFSRGSFNYFTAPVSGLFAFVANGKAIGEANSDLVITDNLLRPGANNDVAFGSTGFRWSNVYSVLGNFSGLITASAGIKIGDVTITYDATNKGLKVSGGGLYSESFISARGANSAGSAGGSTWGLMKKWSDYGSAIKDIDALSAGLGYELYTSKLSTSDAATLYQPKGNYLTSHQSLANYVTLNTEQTITANKSFTGSLIMGANHYIYGINESSGSMLHFDGTRTVIGSVGAQTTAATHFRSKTGHLTVGTGNSASYNVLDTGNYTGTLDNRYLKLTGGTLTSSSFGPLTIKRDDMTNGASICFRGSNSIYGYVGMNASSKDSSLLRWSSDTSKSYKVWDEGNDGSGSGLDADLLDGVHNGSVTARILRDPDYHDVSHRRTTANINFANDCGLHYFLATSKMTEGKPSGDAHIIHAEWDNSLSWASQISLPTTSGGNIEFRQQNKTVWESWKKLAFTSDNVASATKLQTARTIWGQSFDGTANVSGNMTSVGNITTTPLNGRFIKCCGPSHEWGLHMGTGGDNRGIYEWTEGISKWLLYFDASGNTILNMGYVGIGTASPSYKLDVSGSVRASTQVITPLVTNTAVLTLNGATGVYLKYNNEDAKSVVLNGTAFKPFNTANGKLALGIAEARWTTLYAQSANLTSAISSSLTTSTHLAGNKGTAIINSTATAGAYTMLAKMNSTNGYFTEGVYGKEYKLYYTAKTTVDAGTNTTTHQVTLLDEAGLTTVKKLKIGSITLEDVGGNLHIDKGVYSDSFVSAKGLNGQSGGSGTSYNRLDNWSDYASTKADYVLSAKLGYDLYSNKLNATKAAIESLLTGNITTHTHSQYLTAHQSISHLLKIDGSNGTHEGVSALINKLSAIASTGSSATDEMYLVTSSVTPTSDTKYYRRPASLLWNYIKGKTNALYLPLSGGTLTGSLTFANNKRINFNTEDGTAGQTGTDNNYGIWMQYGTDYINVRNSNLYWKNVHKFWHAGNDGSGSGLDADLLDGVHNGELTARVFNGTISADATRTPANHTFIYTTNVNNGTAGLFSANNNANSILTLNRHAGNYNSQLGFSSNGRLYYRNFNGSALNTTTGWSSLAFTSDNVASATKLQTARTIWGQSFDGTANVSGNMTSVGNITGSGAMIVKANGILTLEGTSGVYLKYNNDDTKAVVLNANGEFKPFNTANHKMTLGSASAVWERIYGRYIDTDAGYDLRLCAAGTERIHINNANGYVGINNTSPAYALDILGNQRIASSVAEAGENVSLELWRGTKASWKALNETGTLKFQCNYTDKVGDWYNCMTVAYNTGDTYIRGNLGLGTTTMTYKLNVNGSVCTQNGWLRTIGNFGWYSETYGGGWYMTDANWIRSYGSKGIYHNAGIFRTDGTLQVGSNGARFIVDANGTGINNTAPAYALDIVGNQRISSSVAGAGGDVWLQLWRGQNTSWKILNTGGNLKFQLTVTNNPIDWVDVVTFGESKNVGIGTTSPSHKLHVAGVIYGSTGIFSDGYVSAKGQNTSSDVRLKRNLTPFEIALRQIANAPTVAFDWNNGGHDVGSIAQYWQGINPLLTPKAPDGYLTLQYGKTALLASITIAKAVESVERRVERLERENKELRAELKLLRSNK